MLAKASASKYVKRILAFKKTPVEVLLKSSYENVAGCSSPFAVEYCLVEKQS
jgi:hypothetical protein